MGHSKNISHRDFLIVGIKYSLKNKTLLLKVTWI